MVLRALRGALGFLSRLPVGHDGDSWEAFRATPVSMPLAGYVVGAFLLLPIALPGPAPTIAFAFVVAVYLVTGINHMDGVIDLGDALVVHGGPDERRAVLKDTDVGAGGALAVAIVIAGLLAAGLALAALPLRAALLVVIAEVGAKGGMALLVCFGSAPHDGLGASLTGRSGSRSAPLVVASTVPAAILTWPRIEIAGAMLLAAALVALGSLRLARTALGGVNGDVLGATNEIARIVALHVGVIAWTHW
ncbi:adenosylcobinamide-GDP ribazoletransferase [Halococcus dombrowskii]|uniref:Adenosylcobinamide-GDP ribazoletransferase n=1 Tax=Halococcus dombrowskii TaxID=179637 RepID=A0AAX3ATU4_HALDO|nr:adenosylcobinamide-GDP ribazoletransferase [Halococcus dombrowskii]UOO96372.1 adenosylcobinamide-GDP ribazoletransferase [Halococcus dombrowskii]